MSENEPRHDVDSGPIAPGTTSAASAEATDPTDGSQRAFLTLLYSKYRGSLFRHVNGIVSSPDEAAELVQETYLRVMKQTQVSIFEFSARNYLFATATNLARDYIRRQRHRRHDSLDQSSDVHPAAKEIEPDHLLEWDQAIDALRSGLASLPPVTRDIFVMHRFRDMTYSEIAGALDIGVRTVERRMSEALEYLAARLKGVV